jgi:hypothetical protein
MSAFTERNKLVRYFRMKELDSYMQKVYRWDSLSREQALMDLFQVGEHLIAKALKEPLKADISYRYLHLDKKWIDSYHSESIQRNKKVNSGKKTKAGANQIALSI